MRFGFSPYLYKGLETGSRDVVSHVIKQNQIVFVFQSALTPDNYDQGKHVIRHGDGVKDVAFSVHNLESVVEKARSQGAKIIKEIWSESDDQGTVRMACVQTVYMSQEIISSHFFVVRRYNTHSN
jgi:4-hydroxyphenylpyruvate dioxygenase